MIRTTAAVVAVTVAASVAASADTIDLAAARGRALAAHAGLAAATARTAAAASDVRVAGRRPDPVVAVEAENVGGDLAGAEAAETTVSIVQTLETAGKRRLRLEAAAATRTASAAETEALRRAVVARVDRAFVVLLAAQARLAATREAAAAAAATARTVETLVEAGEVSPIEATRAAMEAALAASDAGRAETAVDVAATALQALWGGGDTTVVAAGDLATVLPQPAEPDRADLETLPEVAAWDARTAAADAEAELARRLAVPDLELGVGARRLRATKEDTWVLSVGLTLPLWSRTADAAAAAAHRADAARLEREATEVELAAAWRTATIELRRTDSELRRVESDILPRAEAVVAAVAEGYRLGTFPLLDLLDARRRLATTRTLHVDLLERRALARAEVIRLRPHHDTPDGDRR